MLDNRITGGGKEGLTCVLVTKLSMETMGEDGVTLQIPSTEVSQRYLPW